MNCLLCPVAQWSSQQTPEVGWIGIIIFPYHRMENWGSEKKNSLSWHIRKGAVSGLSRWLLTPLSWASVQPNGSGRAGAGVAGEARETSSSAMCVKEKSGQTGEEVRVVKYNGSPVSRWSLDNWVAHGGGGGGSVQREQSGREIIDTAYGNLFLAKQWLREAEWTYVPFLWDHCNLGCCPGITRHGALFYSQKHLPCTINHIVTLHTEICIS